MVDPRGQTCFTSAMKTETAVKHFGTKAALARALGIKKQAVSSWGDKVPVGRAYQIEVLTGGALKAARSDAA